MPKDVTAVSATILGYFDLPEPMDWEEAQEWVKEKAQGKDFWFIEIDIEDDVSP